MSYVYVSQEALFGLQVVQTILLIILLILQIFATLPKLLEVGKVG